MGAAPGAGTTPRGAGTQSTPRARRCASSAWTLAVHGATGRSTASPWRPGAPAAAVSESTRGA
jgi:hypothetical protein